MTLLLRVRHNRRQIADTTVFDHDALEDDQYYALYQYPGVADRDLAI